MKTRSFYHALRFILYVAAGIAVFAFSASPVSAEADALCLAVGISMLFYACDAFVHTFIHRAKALHVEQALSAVLTTLLGILLIFPIRRMPECLTVTCVVWAIWAIMREAEEITEKVIMNREHPPVALLNAAESVAVIVLSVMLLLHPGAHHAHTHLVLLGIELILEVLWQPLNKLYARVTGKSAKKAASDMEADVDTVHS